MLKLKLQYFGHLMWRTGLIGKAPDAGKDWRWEEKGTAEDEMASLTQWTWVWASSRRWWGTGKPGVLQFMGSQRVGLHWLTKWNWTELNHEKNFETSIIQNTCPVISKTVKSHQIQRKSEIWSISRGALGDVEEPEIKLPTSAGSWKKRVPEKHLFLLSWLCQSLWLCGSQ